MRIYAALLCMFFADIALAAPEVQPVPLEPRRIGQPAAVLRLRANDILRWQAGQDLIMDMRGAARIYQGETEVAGSRLIVWFRSVETEGKTAGVLDVYGEQGLSVKLMRVPLEMEPPALLRMTAQAGVTVEGASLTAGEEPEIDEFRQRALVAHGDMAPDAEMLADSGLFRDIRPSAEQFIATDLSDTGVTVTLLGNARVVSDQVEILADAIRIRVRFEGGEQGQSPQVQSVYAEGAVDFIRNSERLTAEALYLDWPGEKGLAVDARIRARDAQPGVPVQFAAEAVRQESQQRFSVEGTGYFTTSLLWAPHWRIEGHDIQFVRGPARPHAPEDIGVGATAGAFYERETSEKVNPESLVVSSRRNVVYIESIPVFYWPYVAKDVRSGAFLLADTEFGNSDNLGSFLRLDWDLYDLGLYSNNWSSLILSTDFYTRRGAGTGLEFVYRQDDRLGFLRSYYIHDTASTDDRGMPVPRDNRGELTLRHREILTDKWRAELEIGYLSDRNFLYTYDQAALDEDKDRETQLFVSRLSENTYLNALARFRLNDFANRVERQGAAYHIIGEPVAETPFIWTSHTDVSHLQLRWDEMLDVGDPDDVLRVDTTHEISRPLQAGVLRLDPYVQGSATTFSEDIDGDSVVRGSGGFGVRMASNFYRVYDVKSPLFHVERLRHIITPTAAYENIAWVSEDPKYLIQHDEIDALDETHRLRLGLRNRLQTYRDVHGQRRRVDFALLDVDYVAHFKQSGMYMKHDDYIEATAWWRITENVILASADNRYNVEKGRFEEANGELTLNFWRPFAVSLIQKYYKENRLGQKGDPPSHSVSIVRLGYQPEYSRWRVELSTAYDFQSSGSSATASSRSKLGTGIFMTRQMEGWDFTFGARLNHGRTNETVWVISITPPGIRKPFLSSRTLL